MSKLEFLEVPINNYCNPPIPPRAHRPIGQKIPAKDGKPHLELVRKLIYDPRLQYVPRDSGRVEQNWLDEFVMMGIPMLFGGLIASGGKAIVNETASQIESLMFQILSPAY